MYDRLKNTDWRTRLRDCNGICQTDNDGNLGLIVYGNDGLSSVVAVASSPDLGQGSGALAWLAGTFVGPNVPALIAQPWDN